MIVPHQHRAPAERVSLPWVLMFTKVGYSKHTGRWFQTKLVLLVCLISLAGWLACPGIHSFPFKLWHIMNLIYTLQPQCCFAMCLSDGVQDRKWQENYIDRGTLFLLLGPSSLVYKPAFWNPTILHHLTWWAPFRSHIFWAEHIWLYRKGRWIPRHCS